MQNLIAGFLLGASLIIAIGAQNAFVLRQGLLRSHVFIVALICSLSDALLLCLGVLGVGGLISGNIIALSLLTVCGVVFLSAYGILSLRRVYRGQSMQVAAGGDGRGLRAVVMTVLALTYLNPHVYLDTVVIFGSLSAGKEWAEKLWFLSGAVVSSFVWFYALGYGARLLTPLFARSLTWRLLDAFIAAVMFWLAFGLAVYAIDLWGGLW